MSSYIDDKNLMAECIKLKDFSIVNNIIEKKKKEWTFVIEDGEKIIGYNIYRIKNLSDLYGFEIYGIAFFFKGVAHGFEEEMYKRIEQLVCELKRSINGKEAYYIMKIPCDNLMLLDCINKNFEKTIFCGSTVCYYADSCVGEGKSALDITVKVLGVEEKKAYIKELRKLSYDAFDKFFGQYHISYVTRHKAPEIYSNWIEQFVYTENENIICAFYEGNIIGFLAFQENIATVEIVLNAVAEEYRGKKVYEQMLRLALNICLDKNKLCVISTQMDNYNVQRAWINSGFKPYHSFYLIHLNNRK